MKKVWLITRVDQSVLIANALLNNKQLSRWDTFIVFKEKYKSILRKFFQIADKRFITEELNLYTNKSYTSEIITRFLNVASYNEANIVGDRLFGFLSSLNKPNDFSILHCQAGYGLSTIKKCKKDSNIGIVSDHFGTLKGTLVKQLKDEYSKFGINFKIHNEKILEQRELEAKLSDKIIVPSSFLANEFINIGFNKSKIKIIPYRSHLAKKILDIPYNHIVEKRNEENNKLRILCSVGSVSIAKGIHYLLESFKILQQKFKSEISLTLTGSYNKESKIIFEKYDPKINYLGYVYEDKLINLFINHDIFINPTLNESSSLTNYEAMSAGLPVITTFDAGTPIKNELDGFVIPPKNIDVIQSNIEKLFDATLRKKIGLNARRNIEGIFKKSLSQELNEVYNEIK